MRNYSDKPYESGPLVGGLNSEVSPRLLAPGEFTDGLNVFVNGRAIGRTPNALWLDDVAAGTASLADPHYLLPVTGGGSPAVLVLGTDKAGKWTGASWTNVTPAAGDFTGDYGNRWTGGVLHGVPVVSNGVDAPHGLTGSVLAPLDWDAGNTWADMGYASYALRPYKNMLISLGWDDGATAHPQTVLWSTIADPNTLPPSWDFSDLSNFAGFQPLADRDGDLVDGLPLRDSFIVYAQGAMYRMTFTPQDLNNIMTFSNISMAQGMLAKNCAVELDGSHIVLANDDVIIHDGQTIRSLVEGRRRTAIFGDISTSYYARCQLVLVRPRNEVWVCVPSAASTGMLDFAHVWNWRDDSWSKRELPPGTRFVAEAAIPEGYGSDAWDDDEDTWDADITTWNSGYYSPAARDLLSVHDPYGTASASLCQMNGSYGDALGGTQDTSSITREGLLLAGAPDVRRAICAVELDAEGGTITVEVGASESPNGPYTYTTAGTWTPGTTRDLPVRGPSGFYHAVRFTFAEKTETTLAQYRLRYTTAGIR